MLSFEEIELHHKALIESRVRVACVRSCDVSFANIFGWLHLFDSRVAEVGEWLILKYRIDGLPRTAYMQPLGGADFTPLVPLLAEDAHREGQPLRLLLDGSGVDLLGADDWAVDCNRDACDYIYHRDELAQLSGSAFKAKRNHIARFESRYNYTFEPLTTDNLEECLSVDAEWRLRRGSTDAAEAFALRRKLHCFMDLGLEGGVLRVDGRVVAFTFGSQLTDDTFCVHCEKADTNFDGAYAVVNRMMARQLPDTTRYINREEDLGIEGLRRAKLSYRPAMLLRKYTALQLDDHLRGVRALWCRVFGDQPEWVDRFLARFYDPQLCFTHSEEGRVVAMAHIVPLTTELGRTAYLYAVAVDEPFRGRGLARKVISEALAKVREGWGGEFDAVCVIPADEGLRALYAKFGFADECFAMSFGSRGGDRLGEECFTGAHSTFDLGTGEPTRDLAMVLRLHD